LDNLAIEGVIKVLGLKILVNRLRSQKDSADAREIATPVYKVLNKILETEGELSKLEDTPPAFKSHLRLTATVSLLKLSHIPAFDAFLTAQDRQRMCWMVQDPSWQVRDMVVEKLRKYLTLREIPFKFIVMLLMTAHEPDADILKKVSYKYIYVVHLISLNSEI
jgi:sister-chromatid-cohesion protein PDS5